MAKSKHNYNQYSKNTAKAETVEVTPVETTPVEEVVIPEAVETVTTPEVVTGIVTGCAKLNVRAKPDISATPLCVLNTASEIMINVDKSTSEWFSVTTATGIEGYCMRKFVNAHL